MTHNGHQSNAQDGWLGPTTTILNTLVRRGEKGVLAYHQIDKKRRNHPEAEERWHLYIKSVSIHIYVEVEGLS